MSRLEAAVRSAESRLRVRDGIIRAFTVKLDQLMASSSSEWKEGLRDLHRMFVTELVLNGDDAEVERSAKKVLSAVCSLLRVRVCVCGVFEQLWIRSSSIE